MGEMAGHERSLQKVIGKLSNKVHVVALEVGKPSPRASLGQVGGETNPGAPARRQSSLRLSAGLRGALLCGELFRGAGSVAVDASRGWFNA